MKTPEEIKRGLICCIKSGYCKGCPYEDDCYVNLKNTPMFKDALEYIQQLEANYSQVSKALCGKENATLDEVLQAVSQVKAELEAVKRERDYLLEQIKEVPSADCLFYPFACRLCDAKGKFTGEQCMICRTSRENAGFHFAGVPENSEVQDG